MFQRILVPLDGSEQAERIASWVSGFAKSIGAEVELFGAIDPARLSTPEAGSRRATDQAFMSHAGPEIVDPAMEQARRYLEREVQVFEDAGVKAKINVVAENPADAIVERARSSEIDMVAMATRRQFALARGILGSVTDRVLHNAPVPLLTIGPVDPQKAESQDGQPKTIVVPLDGSELSESSVPVALFLGKALDAHLFFLQALPPPYVAAGELGVQFYTTDYGISEEREQVTRYLATFVHQARNQGLKATARAVVGSPATCILEAIESEPEAMVIMSTHGASGFKRWIVGSVTDKVIRSSGRPVLVLPPAATTRLQEGSEEEV